MNKKTIPAEFNRFPKVGGNFFGGAVFFDRKTNTFYRVEFGAGDNLTCEDIAEGYDDYMNLDAYRLTDGSDRATVEAEIKADGGYIDGIEGLKDVDGGMMLIRRADYADPIDDNFYLYLANALDMMNFKGDYNDLEFICEAE